jgi:predicted TIM-barrel fold metal-dependent hydrolase
MTEQHGPPSNPDIAGPPDHDWARRKLFEESDTDIAMVQAVPVFGSFRNGLGPAETAYALYQSDPDRFFFCGGVDPLYQGMKGALENMERQVKEWGASSMKFYQAQSPTMAWRADDREVAYPLYEKALELGIKLVQFHKGLPLGRQRLEDLKPNDIQLAALDFPDLNFGLHHLGNPYIDETINIASRFENVYLILPLWFNEYFVQPREALHRLGKALLFAGPHKLIYGTDAFIWPNVQAYIDLWMNLKMPEDLQEGYGYPELKRDIKEAVIAKNLVEALGWDFSEVRARVERLKKRGAATP